VRERCAEPPTRTSTSHGASVSTQTVASEVPAYRRRGPRTSSGIGAHGAHSTRCLSLGFPKLSDLFWRVLQSEARIETSTTVAMKGKETQIGTLPTMSEMRNFAPTKTRTIERLIWRSTKLAF
jgi:hypothetical protein